MRYLLILALFLLVFLCGYTATIVSHNLTFLSASLLVAMIGILFIASIYIARKIGVDDKEISLSDIIGTKLTRKLSKIRYKLARLIFGRKRK